MGAVLDAPYALNAKAGLPKKTLLFRFADYVVL
jgi:hypothetical protein